MPFPRLPSLPPPSLFPSFLLSLLPFFPPFFPPPSLFPPSFLYLSSIFPFSLPLFFLLPPLSLSSSFLLFLPLSPTHHPPSCFSSTSPLVSSTPTSDSDHGTIRYVDQSEEMGMVNFYWCSELLQFGDMVEFCMATRSFDGLRYAVDISVVQRARDIRFRV